MSLLSQPTAIELQNISDFEGKEIITEGVVKNYYSNSYGNQVIEIEHQNQSVKLFLEEETDFEYGDIIQVVGEVQRYKDDWEIIVNDKRFVTILDKWNNISFPIWQLAKNPTRYLNINVNVTGYIDIIYDDYFYLVDLDQKYSLIVFYNNINISMFSGQKICALGRFSFDENKLQYKLDIFEENHGIYYEFRRQ